MIGQLSYGECFTMVDVPNIVYMRLARSRCAPSSDPLATYVCLHDGCVSKCSSCTRVVPIKMVAVEEG